MSDNKIKQMLIRLEQEKAKVKKLEQEVQRLKGIAFKALESRHGK